MEKKRIRSTSSADTSSHSEWKVSEECPLLEWLLSHLPQSRNKIKATLKGGGITVNGKVVTRHDFQLQPNDHVQMSRAKQGATLHHRLVKMVYEDAHLVVIEKMPGILSMAAGRRTLHVKAVLDEYFHRSRQNCTAHVVHRLDRDTSGLMIYAKSKQTALQLEEDWHHTVYDRRYASVLSGRMEETEGTVDNYLTDNRAFITFSSATDNGGKRAISHFTTLRLSDNYSLVEWKLETGRKNQIRVHAADMGHPVCGDVKYGNGDDPLHRLCLHAYVLCFIHPVTGQPMEFSTPIPSTFLSLFS